MAFNSIRQPDIHADSTADSTDTPYSVVNFYHLVDIANPFQARQICLHFAETCQALPLSLNARTQIWHKHTASASGSQVIAEHKLWVQGKDLAGRIYLSTQGINAQYSGLTADAEGYAMWLQQQDLFKVWF